ncbi:MAG TPA: 4Fe-4S dicluster domain-containing protein, partial [Proteobacteria bacterium]|nr:4Fe-4S dicluster domain-containing protein [Pseudomonadota bacterium]
NCMVDMARYFLEFTQDESCGKCPPCRIGTKIMLDMLTKITEGKGEEGDIELLEDLANVIKSASLCGLGQTAPNPVLTTIRYFRDEYEAHIKDKYCPAHSCPALLKYRVIEEKCKKCGLCYKACPADAIIWEKKKTAFIDQEKCIKCRSCYEACPFMAIE